MQKLSGSVRVLLGIGIGIELLTASVTHADTTVLLSIETDFIF